MKPKTAKELEQLAKDHFASTRTLERVKSELRKEGVIRYLPKKPTDPSRIMLVKSEYLAE